jgi:hypothetical protein
MNKLIIAVILGCFCAMLAEAMLFGPPKYKDGCDPNPCKNSGACKLTDPVRNKNLSECHCKNGHHGLHCEFEPCSKKNCKHGNCAPHILNKNNITCKCDTGYAGMHCDHEDKCLKGKHKCHNGGRCHNEPIKGEPYCDCTPGWDPHKHCEKQICNITEYKFKQSTKKSAKLLIDKAIEDRVKTLDELAKLCKVHLHILKSYVQHPDKTKAYTYDLKDKTQANHYVGQAISAHIYDLKDNLMCNEICLAKVPCPVHEAKCFLDGLYAIKWKWSILDSTTFHTDYHNNNRIQYNQHREAFQVGCHGKKF